MIQHLRLRSEFEEIIRDYRASDRGVQLLAQSEIALFNGPSGSGRNTLLQALIKTGKYQFIISDTTRQPRVNNGLVEKNGVEYWFKSEEAVLKGLQAGEYIEAAIIHDRQVSGVSINEIRKIALTNKIAVTDIQPDGIKAFLHYKPSTICFFVIPPSFEIWQHRLSARGTMLNAEKKDRLISAITELNDALAHDYFHFVINDDIADAVKQVRLVCEEGVDHSKGARASAQKLLKELTDTISL